MTTRWIRAWALGAAMLASSVAFALDVPIRYVKHQEFSERFRPYGSAMPDKSRTCPAGEWKLPELKCKQPVYALTKFGDKERLLILDAKAGDPFYTRMYFDANANRDLTDDKVFEGTAVVDRGALLISSFPTVDTFIQLGDSSLPYRFQPQVHFFNATEGPAGMPVANPFREGMLGELNWNALTVYLQVECSYAGEFALDGKKFRVMIGDSNGNGRFDDVFKAVDLPGGASLEGQPIFGEADSLYLSPDAETLSYDDEFRLGNYLWMAGKLFAVSISTPDARMTLTPVTEGLSTLKVSQPTDRLGFHSKDGSRCFMALGVDKEIKVPSGEYRLLNYQLTRKEPEGDVWQVCAQATAESPFAKVDGKAEAVLVFGEPYTPRVDATEMDSGDAKNSSVGEVSLDFSLMGIGKEEVTDLSRLQGTRSKFPMSRELGSSNQPKEPSYKIVKMDGEVVTSGSFEYG